MIVGSWQVVVFDLRGWWCDGFDCVVGGEGVHVVIGCCACSGWFVDIGVHCLCVL